MDCLAEYKNYLANTKNSSASTLEAYIRDVKQFVSYCHKEFTNIDAKIIEKYIKDLNKSESTKLRVLASLRAFFKFLVINGKISENPTDNIKLKKTKTHDLGILTADEIVHLLSQPNGDDFKSVRDKAMLELLYATGIKVSELLAVKVSDVNLTIGILHLENGEKERIVPIYPAAVKSLADYIQNVRSAIVSENDNGFLFTNLSGLPMSRQGFWKIIKFYANKASIKKEITPQTLRHSFAAHLLENGAKLKDIKEMLGHSDISSTQVYAKFVKEKYASKYAKFHPLAK